MTVQEFKSKNLTLKVFDTSLKTSWLESLRLRKHLRKSLLIFEDYVLKEWGLGFKKKGISLLSLSLTLCGKEKIKVLNRDYRGKNKITDVLSFPVHDQLHLLKKSPVHILELGDIIICREVVISQAREFSIDRESELMHLLVHGFLHLLGYDHEISLKEEKIMQEIEQKILRKISKKLKEK